MGSVGLCFVSNCLAPGLKTKPFVNYCNLVNRHFPFSPKFRSWLFQLEIKWNGPFRNVVFPAQAEYSYCFDDFRLKILFYYSLLKVFRHSFFEHHTDIRFYSPSDFILVLSAPWNFQPGWLTLDWGLSKFSFKSTDITKVTIDKTFEIGKIRILCDLDLLLTIRHQKINVWCIANNLREK